MSSSSSSSNPKCLTSKIVKEVLDSDVKVSAKAVTALNEHLNSVMYSFASSVIENLGKKKTINAKVLGTSLSDSLLSAEAGSSAVSTFEKNHANLPTKDGKRVSQARNTTANLSLSVSSVTKCFKAALAKISDVKFSFSRNIDVYLTGVIEKYLRTDVIPQALSNLKRSKKKTLTDSHIPDGESSEDSDSDADRVIDPTE